MNRSTILAIAVSAAAACTTQDSPLRITSAFPVSNAVEEGACAVNEEVSQYAGSLDLEARSSYDIAFQFESDLQGTPVSIGGETLADGSPSDFIITEIVFRPSSNPPLSFPEEILPIWAVEQPRTEREGNWIRLDLMPPSAAQVLRDALTLGGPSIQFFATFFVRGRTAAGPISSNQASFPIRVFRGQPLPACAGSKLAPTGPCGSPGGQDGDPIACCSDPGFTTFEGCT